MIVSAPTRSSCLARRAMPEAIAAFIVLTLARPCLAGVNAWTSGGPTGESVGSNVVKRDSAQVLCAALREVHP